MQTFRAGEIVVQDVAVVVQILSSPENGHEIGKFRTDGTTTSSFNPHYHALNGSNLHLCNDNITLNNDDYDDDNIHILSENSSIIISSLKVGNHDKSVLCRSTSWSQLEIKDGLLQDSIASNEVHMMRQMSLFNPYI